MISPKKSSKNQRTINYNYKVIFDNSPISITLLDMRGIIIDTNFVSEDLWGYPKNEIIGKHFLELSVIRPEQQSNMSKTFELVKERNFGATFDMQIQRSDGVFSWITVMVTSFQLGEKKYIQILAQDISKRKHKEQKLENSEKIIKDENEKLKKIDQLRKEFVDVAAHELKSPLTTIHAAIQLLKEMYGKKMTRDKEFIEIIKIIDHGCFNLKNLMDNLLDNSQIEAEVTSLNKEQIDIVEIINSCINSMKYLAEKKNQTIHLRLPNYLFVQADQNKIERVILNLLSNAIKFTPLGGEIELQTFLKDETLTFFIRDSGVGIEEKDYEKLFKKFSRVKTNNDSTISIKGTGLGLYISKKIIELHSGKIGVASKGRNNGTTFYFTLPK
ncbi:MAG: ATP-binding protein [Promethearchaeota archaeon]